MIFYKIHILVLHILFLFQFWTIFPEIISCFAVRALSTFVGVNPIGQQVAATCGRWHRVPVLFRDVLRSLRMSHSPDGPYC